MAGFYGEAGTIIRQSTYPLSHSLWGDTQFLCNFFRRIDFFTSYGHPTDHEEVAQSTHVAGVTISRGTGRLSTRKTILLDLLKAHAQDDLYLGSEEDTLPWAMGCTVGELSGRLFPLTQQA